MAKFKIIVGGFIGLIPAGGVTWDYVQYAVGFRKLGHEVYYIEDTRLYPIYQKEGSDWDDASSCIEHLRTVMQHFGMSHHWAYRDEASGKSFGMSEARIKEVCANADVFVNVSCSTFMRDEYYKIPVRILIDSDPMFTQIQYATEQSFTPGKSGIRECIDTHNFHFTFGESIGAESCLIPLSNIQWKPTRQPVCLNLWKSTSFPDLTGAGFTTLMNWSAGKTLVYQNQCWGQKQEEFDKVKALPRLLPSLKFSMGVGQTGHSQTFSNTDLQKLGWSVLNPESIAGTWVAYQAFINGSLGEFSIAKETYVKAKTGWFSCRSACYLATGRPIVVQETGWTDHIPSGKGALAFTNIEEAVGAIEAVMAEPKQHSVWARQIAEGYFDSDVVLNKLLDCLN